MAVRYLSEEWAQEVQTALNANESFKSQLGSQTASIQNIVTTPDGEKKYWFKVEGGQASLGVGDLDGPADATITQDYDTAVKLSKNELSGTSAYMSGKLRVSGNLMKLMSLQGVLTKLPEALKDVDIEY